MLVWRRWFCSYITDITAILTINGLQHKCLSVTMEWDFRLWAFIVCVWICWRPRAFRGGYRPAPNTRQAFIVRFFLETKQKQKKYSRRARLHWFINRVSDVLQVYAACGGVRGGESESRHWRTYSIYTLHLCMSSLPTGLIYAPEFRSCRKYINIFLPYFYYPLVARTIFDACIYI